MKYRRKPLFKRNEMDRIYHQPGLFAVIPVISHIVSIAIVIACYFFLSAKGYFVNWLIYIYYLAAVIIALQILSAAARSLVVPMLAMLLGIYSLYYHQVHPDFALITRTNSWQLIIIGVIGIFITFVVRSFRR